MIKLKDKEGNIVLGAQINNIPSLENPPELTPIEGKPESKTITITVDGLPTSAGDLQALNAAIRDFHNDKVINKLDISDGSYTFGQLYATLYDLQEKLKEKEEKIEQLQDTIIEMQ